MPAGETATEAGGTHPTGMHSCSTIVFANTLGSAKKAHPAVMNNFFAQKRTLLININALKKFSYNEHHLK